MSNISTTACHELCAITTLVRHIEVIRKTLSNIWDYQEITCMKHRLRDMLTHHTLSLTVRKAIRWLNYSQQKRNCNKINRVIHNKKITILVTVVKKTSYKKCYRKSETQSEWLIIKWQRKCSNQNKNIQLSCKKQLTLMCLIFLKHHQS